MSGAADLARRLAREAEAVCRHYLPQGRRCGRYWIAGDVTGAVGRSLYVRLHGPDYGKGAAGKWTDASTGEYGDLLDLIKGNRQLHDLGDAMDEACRFLSLPGRIPERPRSVLPLLASCDAARRLFNAGRALTGTLAETYLRGRCITAPVDWPALRYHPWVFYRETANSPRQAWPALLAAVTDRGGNITGIQRTWLNPSTAEKAPLVDPRRALGHLLGYGVRFGIADDMLVAGEGIETVLALKSVLPSLPMIAGLSANHLAALELPSSLHRLYIARDNDAAGLTAATRLRQRAGGGIDVRFLIPMYSDFNVDLCQLGAIGLSKHVAGQLAAGDFDRFTAGSIHGSDR
ncbi:MAG TPA: toprim domain-containing protein [Stellaceae bacterium]|jgi:hypothetical protein|nr:toprim domain-containing protein [Stellaceae bacterium]